MMSTFQDEIANAVQSFVTQITSLARRSALDTFESAFMQHTQPDSVIPGRRGPRAGHVKRTATDLGALAERFGAFVAANPGLRIEQINKQLGTVTKDLALPIRKLLADGVITAKGQKRSTTYHPAKKPIVKSEGRPQRAR